MVDAGQIQKHADLAFDQVVEMRRNLHRYPELSNNEYRTSEYIQSRLEKWGISFSGGYAMTGIVAVIEGRDPEKRTIGLRADMDALPVQEETKLPFRSENQGVMHACGHDAHMAMLLGAAGILNDLRHDFYGCIMLIFQPSEEKLPGGALRMIEEGILETYRPDIIIAQHVMPELPSGTVGFCPGKYMASTDEIYITIHGKGGHAAMPEQLVDSVQIAAQLLVELRQASNRMAPPAVPTVLSFGRIEADGANNVIPSHVKLFGTFRTRDEEWRDRAHLKIKDLCHSVVKKMGGSCDIEIERGYPALNNDPEITGQAIGFSGKYLDDRLVRSLKPQMTAEDFAYFARKVPAVLYRLGTGGENNEHNHPLHSPRFSIDEASLKTGTGLLCWLALSFMDKT